MLAGIFILIYQAIRKPASVGSYIGSMTCKTAFLFILAGTALAILSSAAANRLLKRCATMLALLIAMVAVITFLDRGLIAFFQNINLRAYDVPRVVERILIGQMSQITSCVFVLCSAGLLLLRREVRTPASIMGVIVALVGWINLIGHLNGVTQLYGKNILPIAISTSLVFIAFGIGLISATGPHAWPLRSFIGHSTTALLLRWLLPLVLILMSIRGQIVNAIVGTPDRKEVLVSTLIDLIALSIVGIAIVQVSRLLGGMIDRAQNATKESEGRFRELTESSLMGVCVIQEGTIRYANPALAEMIGYSDDCLLDMRILTLVHPDDQPMITEISRRLIAEETEIVQHDCRLIRKCGRSIDAQILGRRILHQGRPAIMSTVQDVTEQRRAEEALRRSRKDHARLSRDREKLLEQERARISRHLHDELGQHLTYLLLQLAHMEKRLEGADKALVEEFKETSQQAKAMIANVRSVAQSLRPIAIEHDGLIPSLHSSVEEFRRISGVGCRLIIDLGNYTVKEPLATAVYRIIQEGLTNVARHARACTCEIRLSITDGYLDLTLRDDGKGAPATALGGHHSLGIIGMKERASASGGKLWVRSDGRSGVTLQARFPLTPELPEETGE